MASYARKLARPEIMGWFLEETITGMEETGLFTKNKVVIWRGWRTKCKQCFIEMELVEKDCNPIPLFVCPNCKLTTLVLKRKIE